MAEAGFACPILAGARLTWSGPTRAVGAARYTAAGSADPVDRLAGGVAGADGADQLASAPGEAVELATSQPSKPLTAGGPVAIRPFS